MARPRPITAIEASTAAGADRAALDRLAAAGFSRTAIDIAEVIGALTKLHELVTLEAMAPRAIRAEIRLLQVRQDIAHKVVLATLDISSTLAEIDCEGERGDKLSSRLQGLDDRRSRRLNLAAIAAGALTAIVSGGLGLAGVAGADLTGIVGGTAEATAATSLLFGSASGELRVGRNLPGEVWEGPAQPRLLPRSVWRFLTKRESDAPDRPTIAETLRAEWRAGERLGPAGSQTERDRIEMLFGSGGVYTIEELNLRDGTLDLLEANVALMSQNLRVLMDELAERPRGGRASRETIP